MANNEKRVAFQLLCNEIAQERVEILFPNTPDNKKELYVKALRIRLSRMYDDFFDAGHLNDITIDTVEEINAIEKNKAFEQARNIAKAQVKTGKKPETTIRVVGATPEQVMAILCSHGLCG